MKLVEPTYDWSRTVAPQYITPEGVHWRIASSIFHKTEFEVRDYTLEVMEQIDELIKELKLKHDFSST